MDKTTETQERIDFAIEYLSDYPIKVISKALKISKRAYLYNLNKENRVKERELETAVINCFNRNKGNYGRPRIKIQLASEGIHISEGKIGRILKENGIVSSMSRPGIPNDNQIVESLWNSIKTEIGSLTKCRKAEAIVEIHEYISNYYNIKRVHSGIGYLTPVEVYNQLMDNSSNPSPE